ncbi:MAG: phospho-N-acetylmuramoyl-pentapeptide-transferase [Nitrospinota bacterium]|nr:phospho-N-acetylmuramoyl-pentapeptide-transferase [Nitrospinota bacterium]
MLYHLLYPLSDTFSALNVFRYITFRSIYALLTALAIALIMGPMVIRWLKAKNIGEKIRSDGPKSHQSKKGTPTMGGILIIISLMVPTLLWADFLNGYVLIAMMTVVLFSIIGFYDDYMKLTGRGSGMSGWTKLGLQAGAGLMVAGAVYMVQGGATEITSVHIPFFKNLHPDLGVFYLPFAALVIVASANAVNLTDGLDGLAIGPIFIAFLVYMVFCYTEGHAGFAKYLNIPHIGELSELTVFCAAVVGASLGFVWFNFYPAMVFMGNVGSQALGGALGAVAVMAKQEVVLALVGGIFVVETLSVIIQVVSYKSTGKRVFKMAPLHHHFEQLGWPEPQVIVRFWVVAIVFAMISLSTLKLR